MDTSWTFWIGFNAAFIMAVFFDLFFQSKREDDLSTEHHLKLTALWIAMALGFNVLVYFTHGQEAALNFFTGYLIEKSLSIDNLFVFMLIFNYFQTPKKYEHKVLFYGILSAIVMRALFIFGGIALIQQFHWVFNVLAIFLIVGGFKMFFKGETEIDPDQNFVLMLLHKWVPFTKQHRNGYFFVHEMGRWIATPLFAALITIEITDLIFAIDSIPAILGITQDPFIVYTSNVLALMGLRALYFSLSTFLDLFHYLYLALGVILIFVGLKMLLAPIYPISTVVSLGFVFFTITIAALFSIWFPHPTKFK